MAKTVDLRTYLLLERAFVRRLQRSWRMLSAPTYALITQACLDHKWDEARRLVPELDMTEVGTENREWITYMLLSCAVFGAGTVRKGKPSFVGVGTFDTFLKQVTNNILTYLELSATAQVQEEALQSIAEDEAKTKALKREYVRDEQGRFAETAVGGRPKIEAVEQALEEARIQLTNENGMHVRQMSYSLYEVLITGLKQREYKKPVRSELVEAYRKAPETIPPVSVRRRHEGDTGRALVLDGHHRIKAAKAAGLKSLWVVEVHGTASLPDEELRYPFEAGPHLKHVFKRDYVREPAGTSEGGQFASTGTSGVSASHPVLAAQAKAGIAAVEKLLPVAIQTAEYSSGEPQAWDSVSEEGQEEAYHKYVENAYDDIEVDESSLREEFEDDLEKDNQKVLDEAVEDVERQLSYESFIDEFGAQRALAVGEGDAEHPATVEEQFRLKKTLDIDTLDYGYGNHEDDGTVTLDWDKLRFTNGEELTEDEKDIVKKHWDVAYKKAFESHLQEEYDSDTYMEKLSEMRDEAAREQWNNLDDDEKLQYFNDYVSGRYGGRNWKRQMRAGEPDEWVTGVETGTHSEENYARTHAIALKLAELRTDELLEERGLTKPQEKPEYEIVESVNHTPEHPSYIVKVKGTGRLIAASNTKEQAEWNAEKYLRDEQERLAGITAEKIIEPVWDQWKRSSSEGLSMSVQLAAARELGGHHRMTPEEVVEAEANAVDYGGIPVLQAYVRAQWEVTQMVMAKAKADKIEVFRGLMLPGNMVNATTRVFIDDEGNKITYSNITTGVDKVAGNKPFVGFDFDNEHFVVHKERRAPKSITEIAPETWHQVDEVTKAKVKEQWDKDAAETLVDPEIVALNPERGKELIDKLYQKLGDDGRFDLMHTYAAQGRITLPKFDLLPYETDEEAIQRRLTTYMGQYGGKTYTRLPDLRLQRAGAQSTTGTPSVANSWGGVGNLPDNPTRVVIRIEAPPTSVFSLPVYGQNSQEEHETVVLGTKDKWLWDAWQNRAPNFTESHPIAGQYLPKELMPKKPLEVEWPKPVDYDTEQALKAEKPPLVIDLQAEDRGKPHWMSTVDWAKVEETEK